LAVIHPLIDQKPLLMLTLRCSLPFSITALSPLAERNRQPLLPMLSPAAALVELLPS
jgi:hypothetical protein